MGVFSGVVGTYSKNMVGLSKEVIVFSSYKSTRGEENLADPTKGKMGPWFEQKKYLVLSNALSKDHRPCLPERIL